MTVKEEINYLQTIPTKCDCCGEMVNGFYDKSGQWWDRYLNPDEESICLGCIADRPGFRKEYRQLIGMSVDDGMELYGN